MDKRRWNLISEKMREALLKALQDTGKKIFDKSQSNISDDEYLKSTGSIDLKEDGWKIEYSDPLALDKEFGTPKQQIRGSQTYEVASYTRQGYVRSNGAIVPPHTVKGYSVTLEDKKIISFIDRGKKEFRTISEIKEKQGKFFLSSAINEELKNELPDDIKKRIEEIKL